MRKTFAVILVGILLMAWFTGCGRQEEKTEAETPNAAIGNPWSDWASMEEAQARVGFSYGLPEEMAGSYTAVAYRTMNDELLEVIYRDGEQEIRVRKQAGEGQDISGDYNQYDIRTEETIDGAAVIIFQSSDHHGVKQLISAGGYSWSVTAPEGFPGDGGRDFVNAILN